MKTFIYLFILLFFISTVSIAAEKIIIDLKTGKVTQRILTTEEELKRKLLEDSWKAKAVQRNTLKEIIDNKRNLDDDTVWLFRMLLELYEVGNTKGVWDNTNFSKEIKQKVNDWKQNLRRLEELGE